MRQAGGLAHLVTRHLISASCALGHAPGSGGYAMCLCIYCPPGRTQHRAQEEGVARGGRRGRSGQDAEVTSFSEEVMFQVSLQG